MYRHGDAPLRVSPALAGGPVKAAVYRGRRDVRIESVPEPGEPAAGGLVLEVVRAAICGTDAAEWDHGPVLCRSGVVLGHEFVGRVAATSPDVDSFSVGDLVVSGAGVSCGSCRWCASGRTNLCATYETLGLQLDGGLAALVATPASICRRVPDGCGEDAAALAQPLAVALHGLRRSGIATGDSIAIIGVGGIGAFLVAGARARGAARVVAVDIDDERLTTASALGAHDLVNVAGKELAATLAELGAATGFDVVVESSGAPAGPAAALAGVRRGGTVLLVGLQSGPRELDLLSTTLREVDIHATVAHVCDVDIPAALALLAASELAETVIDRRIALDDLVEAGLRPLAERTARGKIVVDLTA